jgi:hypothetical protein
MENHKHIAVDRSAVDIIKEEKEETYNNGCS